MERRMSRQSTTINNIAKINKQIDKDKQSNRLATKYTSKQKDSGHKRRGQKHGEEDESAINYIAKINKQIDKDKESNRPATKYTSKQTDSGRTRRGQKHGEEDESACQQQSTTLQR